MDPESKSCDFLIVGGGIAGLSAALEASRAYRPACRTGRQAGKYGKVIILTKGKIGESATEKAQGGIAAAIDQIRDSTQFHFEDTIAAGAGLCHEEAVRILVTEGVERVRELIEMGAQFDRAETEGGGFALTLEGAHKRRRILHAGDSTGKEIEKTLGRKAVSNPAIEIHQQVMGIDLIIEEGRCIGVSALDQKSNSVVSYLSKAVIIATGGVGQAYLYTTNPSFSTGDGIAMAYRAGAQVADMEFVQFHPTSLVHFKQFEDIIALPQFLISEAVRGEGGVLINERGERFVPELAPRDVVARAIFNQKQVFLSLKGVDPDKIKKRFPLIYKTCLERGLDITKDNIPVAPAAHYFMGGIKTDVDGKTNLAGLYAAGECASTGVHGANRLASNSLLEGLVFGHRAAITAKSLLTHPDIRRGPPSPSSMERGIKGVRKDIEIQRYKMVIKTAMWNGAGIIRSKESIEFALHKLEMVEKQQINNIEVKNMLLISQLIARAALERTESRGAHFRSDYPNTNDKNWKRHLIYSAGSSPSPEAETRK